MKDVRSIFAYIGSGVTAVAGLLNTNEVLQITLTILGILGAVVTLFLNGWRIFDKIKDAAKDGHISEDEKEEIKKDIKDAVDDFKEDIK